MYKMVWKLTAVKVATPKLRLSVSMPMLAQCLCADGQLIGLRCSSRRRRLFAMYYAECFDALVQARRHLAQRVSASRRFQPQE